MMHPIRFKNARIRRAKRCAIALAALGALGCTDDFSDRCAESLTCDSPEGGASATGGSGNATGGSETGGASTGGSGAGGSADPCDACEAPTPACNDAKECVECTGDAHCGADAALCDTSAEKCVECLAASDCSDPSAAKCAEGACGACTVDDDCAHIPDKGVCETGAGSCVECTDSSHCGGNPCNLTTNTCSEFGTTQDTCEVCDTDENCGVPDNFCVPMEYKGEDRPGGYCLKKAPACSRPFAVGITGRTTLSGVTNQTYCGINEALVTCEAVRALLDGVECPGGDSSECPESGLCQDIGGTLTNQCTYTCTTVQDCTVAGSGSTCGTAPDNYCGFVL